MNKQTFIQLIKNPSGISPEQLLELEKVVAGFPYCQAAYILIAKQAAETGSMLADQQLKKASAYTLDRKNLKKLLQGKKELTPVEHKNISQKILPVIEITKEELPILKEETIISKQNTNEELNPIISTSHEEKRVVKEALTDKQRDQILEELKENLKKLHENKIKAAWEEIPEEIKLVEEPLLEEKKEILVENSILKIEQEIVVNTNYETSYLLKPSINYPIRTEDEVVEIKETEADTDLLLEYLDFLEEKRGIFRKNKKKEGAIIDKIIKEDPSIPKLDINNLPDSSVDLSSKSITISKEPVSENFAKILGLQGKKDKAIEIYEQLILKNPEKKPYFEALIEKLKNKI